MFGFKKKPKSIYGQIIKGHNLSAPGEDGQFELDVLEGRRKIEKVNTDPLDVAILEFFAREPWAIEHVDNFFKKNHALEAIPSFENWLYGFDQMNQPMLGLSILLMRDSQIVEAVKFGIYLTRFTDLEGNPMVLNIVKNLGKHPAFSYYALDALLNAEKGTYHFYDLGQELEGVGKSLYKYMAVQLLEKGK